MIKYVRRCPIQTAREINEEKKIARHRTVADTPMLEQFQSMILNRILVGIVTVAYLLGGPAMAVEEPAFQTVLKDGAFEIRDYPALAVAEVTVTGEQKEAARKGFSLLAAYIFGGNGSPPRA